MLAFARSFLAFCAIILVVWEKRSLKSDLVWYDKSKLSEVKRSCVLNESGVAVQ